MSDKPTKAGGSQSDARLEERRQVILERYRGERVTDLQERITRDPALGLQLVLDPLETLSRFGLIDTEVRDFEMRITEGSFLDLVHLRRAVDSRGIDNILASEQDTQLTADAVQRIKVGISGQFCVTICWLGACIKVCISGTTGTVAR
jgi:hypothetical protein